MLIFAGIFDPPHRSAGSYRQKEDQVEIRSRSEQVTEHSREDQRSVRLAGFDARRDAPWSALTFDDGPDPSWTSHCTEHARHTRRSRREIEADTREGLSALQSLGVEPRLWRPPWGIRAPWTEEIAESFGLRLAPWSADTKDWRGDAAPEMLGRIEPLLGPGSVVLMHDGLGPGVQRTGCRETVALVEPLVTRLRGLGYEPTPLAAAVEGQRVEA
jgi:peptidoglycan/xylan/chitin deacetylase (PgdA/CDA1 family)